MSVLTAAQSAGFRLLGVKPISLFSTTDTFAMELADLANDVAVDIAEEHDWQLLKKLASLPGDGSTIGSSLPPDYARMLKKARVHSKNWQTEDFTPVRDEDQWIYIQDTAVSGTPGQWIILGGQMQIYPPMAADEVARFYYISNKIVSGATKVAFTADTDTFDLPERLLTLGLIWRWRSQKRLEYAEDMANYEKALATAIANDKGSRVLVVGRQRGHGAESIAYPGTLGQ